MMARFNSDFVFAATARSQAKFITTAYDLKLAGRLRPTKRTMLATIARFYATAGAALYVANTSRST